MEYLLFETKGRVGILTINRPQAMNALNSGLLKELENFLFKGIQKENIQVLMVTGAGQKAFCAGDDVKEMQSLDRASVLSLCALAQRITVQLETMEVVTMAALNGYALGGGLEIALSCDLVYASRNASLGLPEVNLGLTPVLGGTRRLPRAVGICRAKDMIFSGTLIPAEDAFAIGLVNKVVEGDQLLDECLAKANQICQKSFVAVIQAKRAIHDGIDLTLSDALALEREAFAVAFATEDRAEGIAAFLEKRPPHFITTKDKMGSDETDSSN